MGRRVTQEEDMAVGMEPSVVPKLMTYHPRWQFSPVLSEFLAWHLVSRLRVPPMSRVQRPAPQERRVQERTQQQKFRQAWYTVRRREGRMSGGWGMDEDGGKEGCGWELGSWAFFNGVRKK